MLAYLKMLVRDKIASYKPSSYGKENDSKLKTVGKYAGFTLLALYLYAIVVFLEVMIYNTGAQFGEPQLLIAVVFLISTIITLFYSFFYVISTLFFGKDTLFLGAMPISSRGIMSSKLLMVILGEAGLTILIAAPIIVLYGINYGMGVTFYLRALIGTLFVPLAPIALSTLLSCLLIRVSALWKRREGVTVVMTFLLMAGLIAFQMNMGANISEAKLSDMVLSLLFKKGSLTDILMNAYPPMRWLVTGITGSGLAAWGNLALFIAASIAVIALVIFLFGGSYMRLALKQQENIRRSNVVRRKLGADHMRKPFWAIFRQEMREVITVPVYATNCLTGCVLFPVMIVIMFINFKGQMPGLDIAKELLTQVPSDLLTIIITGALCMTAVMGMAGSTAVSREGRQHEMRKTYPVSGFTHLSAKLLMGMSYNAIATLFTAITVCVIIPALWAPVLISFVASQLFNLLVSALGLILDTYRARLNWKTETEAVKQNFNSFLSMLITMGVLAAFVGLFMLGLKANMSLELLFALTVVLMLVADWILLKWLKGKVSAVYYLR